MKNGDVVFFKKAKTTSARKGLEIGFKGYGFGVMLGHVLPFAADPKPEMLLRLMGTIGFVSFDDVGELLGNEQAANLVKAFEDKYYGKVVDTAQADLPIGDDSKVHEEPVRPSGLVAINGAPIPSSEKPLEN